MAGPIDNIMNLFRHNPNPAPAANPGVDPSRANPALQPQPSPVDTHAKDVMANKAPGGDGGNDPTKIAGGPAKDSPEANPLDGLKSLWETTPNADAKVRPALSADPTKIAEAAKKINFTKGIDPAIAQKALGGDVNALMQLFQTVGENAFSVGTQASTHLVDRHVQQVSDYDRRQLPSTIRLNSARDSLMAENQMLSHPAVKPVVDVIQAQLTQKYPEASAAEIQQQTLIWLKGVAELAIPGAAEFAKTQQQQKDSPAAKKQGEPDFFEWAGLQS